MKIILFISIGLIFMYACTPKGKTDSGSANDSVKPETKRTDTAKTETPLPVKIPVDTIPISYPNGSKFHFLVYEYYDSLPAKYIRSFYDSLINRKLIYDFEIKDATTDESIFRSVSAKLALGDEVDPMNEEFDSLFVTPAYSVSSLNPLTVNLDFFVKGGFMIGYLGAVTYPFYKETDKILKFLRYTFQFSNNRLVIRSFLRFKPNKCTVTEEELIQLLNIIKKEKHFNSEQGSNLMKSAFICFLNDSNSEYYRMLKEFKIGMTPTSDEPYNYYPYINYLSEFIVNLTSP